MRKNKTFKGSRRVVFLLLTVFLAGSALIAVHVSAARRWMRNDLLDRTIRTAQAVNVEYVLSLSGTEEDLVSPAYLRIKNFLTAVQQTEGDLRFIFLLGRQPDGTVIILADSEPPESEDYSPPGDVYYEAGYRESFVFEKAAAQIFPPAKDRWGTWISAYAPLIDPQTGNVAALFGIDIDANEWRRDLARAAVPVAALTIALIALILTGLFLEQRKEIKKSEGLFQFLDIFLIAAAGALITFTLALTAHRIESRQIKKTFGRLAGGETDRIHHAVQTLSELSLPAFARFFEASEEVTPAEFYHYIDPLKKTPGVMAWGWIERIPSEKKETFEKKISPEQEGAFRIWERSEQNVKVPAKERPDYYVLRYMGPLDTHKGGEGFDLGSDPLRRAALEETMRTGLPTATDPLELVTESTDRHAMIVFHPVFDYPEGRVLRGFAGATLHPEVLMQSMGKTPLLHCALYLLCPDRPPRFAASLCPDPGKSFHERTKAVSYIKVFGKVFCITAHPSSDFHAAYPKRAGMLTGAAGLLITIALAGLIGAPLSNRRLLEYLVKDKTASLKKSQDRYELLAEQSGTFVWETDETGLYTYVSHTIQKITGYAPEELIGKKYFYDLSAPEDKESVKEFGLKALRSGSPFSDYENRILTKTGQTIWVSTVGMPLHSPDGALTGFYGSDTDITEQKKASTEKTRLLDEAQTAHRILLGLVEDQKLTEEALTKSEKKYRLLFENMTAGFAVHEMVYDPYGEPVDYRFLQINPAFEEMTGLRADEVIRHTATEILPNIEPLWIKKYGQVVKTGKSVAFESFSKSINKYFEVRAFFTQKDHFATVFNDITDRKRMQTALEKRVLALTRPLEETKGFLFEDLFDLPTIQKIQDDFAAAAGVASIITHPDGAPITQPSNFTDLYCKYLRPEPPGAADCFSSISIENPRPDQPVVKSCLNGCLLNAAVIISVGETHVGKWIIGQVRDDNTSEQQALQYARSSGFDEEVFLAKFRKAPVMSKERFETVVQALFTLAGHISMSAYMNVQQARFIADEKRRTRELVRLSTVTEQSPEAIVITDSNGIIEYVNPAFERISGYRREELTGRNPKILKSGVHDKNFYEKMWNTISSGEVWTGQFVNRRKNEELYTEEAIIAPIRDENGVISHYVGIKRDITAELEQEELLQQSQKMEAVGRLAGGIAHDFNNILQAILGFSELLVLKLPDNTPEHRNADQIKKASLRAADLVSELLAFSRKQPVERKEISLNTVVRDSEVLLHVLLKDFIRLHLDLDPDIYPVCADPSQISQVIMNLSVNARDAMPEGGTLTLATDNVTIQAEDKLSLPESRPGVFVCLSITDTGQGMTEEVKKHIFEPFFTTKEVGKGTGLGLAVVYGIVKQNNGWLSVYSEPGMGTTFKVYLPSVIPGDKTTPGEKPGPAARRKILLVEDDLKLRSLVVKILTSADYEPVAAATAEEAELLFEKDADGFSLLFSDIVLPGKSGIDLAGQLRKIKPDLRVLLYSGYRDQKERWKEIGGEGYHFTEKPFTASGLLGAVYAAVTEPV